MTKIIEFDDDQLKLIRNTATKGATNDEFELFIYQCERLGLDPLARQIRFQKFKDNATYITTIDGYRLVADRTGDYAGNSEPIFEGRIDITDGASYEHTVAPAKVTMTVHKIVHGVAMPFSASAYWSEYYPGGKSGRMWRKMPHVMLAKVAEALALRKAFPADLSGVYTDEEMDQAGGDEKFDGKKVAPKGVPLPEFVKPEWADLYKEVKQSVSDDEFVQIQTIGYPLSAPSQQNIPLVAKSLIYCTDKNKWRKGFHAKGNAAWGDRWEDRRHVMSESFGVESSNDYSLAQRYVAIWRVSREQEVLMNAAEFYGDEWEDGLTKLLEAEFEGNSLYEVTNPQIESIALTLSV